MFRTVREVKEKYFPERLKKEDFEIEQRPKTIIGQISKINEGKQ